MALYKVILDVSGLLEYSGSTGNIHPIYLYPFSGVTTTTTTTIIVDFSLHATTCNNIRADYFTGGSDTFDISTQLYSTSNAALNGSFTSASDPTDYAASASASYWVALRDTYNTSNKVAKSAVTPACPTTTTTTTGIGTTTTTTIIPTTTTTTTAIPCNQCSYHFSLYNIHSSVDFSYSYFSANQALCEKITNGGGISASYASLSYDSIPTNGATLYQANCTHTPAGFYIYYPFPLTNTWVVQVDSNGVISNIWEPVCATCYSVNLGFHSTSSSSACAAAQNGYKLDTNDLSTATLIGTSASCYDMAISGYYSDGSIYRYWDGYWGILDTEHSC